MKIGTFLLSFMALIGCSMTASAAMPVTVSIVPQQYFVEQVGGDLVDVSVMVQPGASPASYEPKPMQMAALSKARIYFATGVPFESAWLERIESANHHMSVVHMDRGIDKLPMARHHHHEVVADEEEHHEHHHGHEGMHHEEGESVHHEGHQAMHSGHDHDHMHGVLDPHVWTAPPLVKVMARTILDELVKADPAHTATYQANYAAFVERIDALDSRLRELFDGIGDNDRFMVYHPAWGYFARTYGLTQIPIELEGKEPGPRQLAELIHHAKEENIHVIFVQPQFSEKSAGLIAKAIDGSVVKADPLAYNWFENLLKVGEAFRNALK